MWERAHEEEAAVCDALVGVGSVAGLQVPQTTISASGLSLTWSTHIAAKVTLNSSHMQRKGGSSSRCIVFTFPVFSREQFRP